MYSSSCSCALMGIWSGKHTHTHTHIFHIICLGRRRRPAVRCCSQRKAKARTHRIRIVVSDILNPNAHESPPHVAPQQLFIPQTHASHPPPAPPQKKRVHLYLFLIFTSTGADGRGEANRPIYLDATGSPFNCRSLLRTHVCPGFGRGGGRGRGSAYLYAVIIAPTRRRDSIE